jgi:TolB-like protein/class 3 adenylate cyclase/cytochrome c-type biogenesis protein CcmH/NrfG
MKVIIMSSEQKVARKLRAIFSADVKGYSILMADDEVSTVQTLKDYQKIMSACIEQRDGRVVDAVGDNLLAEFESAVDAVQCAVEVQKELKEKNEGLTEEKRMEFRIGINIGDVIQDGDRIFGDGVNVASRIEGLADPGGVCISRNAHDHVKGKLELGFENLGEYEVKNIKEPVRIYRVMLESASAGVSIDWKTSANIAKSLSDKPSIAVLPFVNMSGDDEQEYVADGLTENIITALSKIPQVFVIARNSTFTYKGLAVKVQKVARELGVRFVMEGSVQKAGEMVRITAQLIDAISGHHIWAERYDRKLNDVFAVQDEITLKVVVALQVELTDGEQAQVRHRSTTNLDAWGYWVKAYDLFEKHTKEGYAKARELLDHSLKLDPRYANALALKAVTHFQDIHFGYAESPAESFMQSVELCQKAISIDDSEPDSLALWGLLQMAQRQYDEAIKYGEKALALGPNNAEVHALLAFIKHYVGKNKEAIGLLKKAILLQPNYHAWYSQYLGMAYTESQEYDLALSAFEDVTIKAPHQTWGFLWLAVVYIRLGREEKAKKQIVKAMAVNPELSRESLSAANFYKNPKTWERLMEDRRQAGLK